jgi:hypothetical protein
MAMYNNRSNIDSDRKNIVVRGSWHLLTLMRTRLVANGYDDDIRWNDNIQRTREPNRDYYLYITIDPSKDIKEVQYFSQKGIHKTEDINIIDDLHFERVINYLVGKLLIKQKDIIKAYTIEDLRKKKTWVHCTTIEQGQKLGKYYYQDQNNSDTWQNFNFNGHKEFYIYIDTANGITGGGGWMPYIDPSFMKDDPIIEFSQVIFPEQKVVSYKLIKPYPGHTTIGLVIPATKTNESFCKDYPEFWEPVYEEKKPVIKFGDYVAKVDRSHGRDGIGSRCIKFGCQSFFIKDLITVKQLLSKEVKADITIHGTKVTRDMIDQLIKMIEA